jgi:hypothetical protein
MALRKIMGRWRETSGHMISSTVVHLRRVQLYFPARCYVLQVSRLRLSSPIFYFSKLPSQNITTMGIVSRFRGSHSAASSETQDVERKPSEIDMTDTSQISQRFRPRILLMGIVVSMGGFIFGYDTGLIPDALFVKQNV